MDTIFVASMNERLVEKLSALLVGAGNTMEGTSESGNDTIRRCRQTVPDIVILSQRLKDMSGLAAAEILQEFTQCVVLLDAQSLGCIQRTTGAVYLQLPLAPDILLNTISVLSQVKVRVNHLTTRISSLESNIREQKTINQAKAKLMSLYDLNEEEAHAFLRKVAMNKRVKLYEAAQLIHEEFKNQE